MISLRSGLLYFYLLLPLCATPVLGQKAIFETIEIFPLVTDHVHGSTLVELPDGTLLAAWFQGSGERQAEDVAIMGSRFDPEDNAWSVPFVMADTPDFPDINPVLFLDVENRLWLMWYTVIAHQWETSLLKYRISQNYSDEGAPSWQWQEVLHVKPGDKSEYGVQPDDRFVVSVREKATEYEEITSIHRIQRKISISKVFGWKFH